MPLEDITTFTSALLRYHFDYNLEHVILLKTACCIRESRQDILESVINVKMGKIERNKEWYGQLCRWMLVFRCDWEDRKGSCSVVFWRTSTHNDYFNWCKRKVRKIDNISKKCGEIKNNVIYWIKKMKIEGNQL